MTDTYQLDDITLAHVTELKEQGKYAEAYKAIADVAPITDPIDPQKMRNERSVFWAGHQF